MTTASPDVLIAGLASRQYGVFSRTQARELGAGRNFIKTRLATGRWVRVEHNVFRLNGTTPTWRQSLLIACLSWGSGAAISHRAAGSLWRLAGIERQIVELTVALNRRGGGAGIVHRNRLEGVDVEIFDGIRVTSVARTLIDLAAVLRPETLEEVFDDALIKGLVSIPRIRWRLSEIAGGKGRHGVLLVRQLLEDRQKYGVPRSIFETRMLRLLKRSGLPRPERQYKVHDIGNKRFAAIDFAFPSQKIGIETDGFQWHSGKARWQSDRSRRNWLTKLGWRLIHVTWDDLNGSPEEVVETIGRLLIPG